MVPKSARVILGFGGCLLLSGVFGCADYGRLHCNQPPVAEAGADQIVAVGAVVSLDGTGSRDPDGDSLSYHWSLVDLPGGSRALLSHPLSPTPSFTADLESDYLVRLVVGDGLLESEPDQAKVTAMGPDNRPPIADAGPDQEVFVGEVVTLEGSGSSDPDGDSLTYSWSFTGKPEGSAADFSDPSASELNFVADVAGVYSIGLVVFDGELESPADTATISVQGIFRLGFWVIDAGYSRQLERMVMVSANPGRLHVYDPVGHEDSIAELDFVPTCLSVGADGQYAAVGHDGWISYVDLAGGSVVKTLAVSADIYDVVLAGNGYAYAFPASSQPEPVRCIDVATGEESLGTGFFSGLFFKGKLHPDGKAIYAGDGGYSLNGVLKYGIENRTAEVLWQFSGPDIYGDLWITEGGERIISRSHSVFWLTADSAGEIQKAGELAELGEIEELCSSVASQTVAVIPRFDQDTHVLFYGYQSLGFQERIELPPFVVGGTEYPAHGRFVFFSEDAGRMFVIVQADASSGLLYDYGVVTFTR